MHNQELGDFYVQIFTRFFCDSLRISNWDKSVLLSRSFKAACCRRCCMLANNFSSLVSIKYPNPFCRCEPIKGIHLSYRIEIPEHLCFHCRVTWIKRPKLQQKSYHLDVQEVLLSEVFKSS